MTETNLPRRGYALRDAHCITDRALRHAGTACQRRRGELDAQVDPGGVPIKSVNPAVQVGEGQADFDTYWIANMLVQRQAKQLDLVHIAQIFQLPAYAFVAQHASGLKTIADFKGKRVGVWAFGNEFPAEVCFRVHGLTEMQTTVYAFDPALVFPNRVDVASAMLYNEPQSGISRPGGAGLLWCYMSRL